MFVADGWTMDREPTLASNSVMDDGINNVVAEWADRMPGEGELLVNGAFEDANERFDEAEQDPAVRHQMMQIFDINRDSQQDILAELHAGNRPGWLWDHRTNRK